MDADTREALGEMQDLLASMGHELIEAPFPVDIASFAEAWVAVFSTRPTLLRQIVGARIG